MVRTKYMVNTDPYIPKDELCGKGCQFIKKEYASDYGSNPYLYGFFCILYQISLKYGENELGFYVRKCLRCKEDSETS